MPELKVLLDTNALYTGTASDLLTHEVVDLIKASTKHTDLIVKWYVPDVVIAERVYQMNKAALALLPPVQKLERLLGHGLNITDEIVRSRVLETVQRQIDEHGLNVLPLDLNSVRWNTIIDNAVNRRPPFESGEHEGGFRDALVAESFVQIVQSSPSSSKSCRIALVTGDKLLTEACLSRSGGAKNVRILANLEELKGLISTLVSEVSEDFVVSIQEGANGYFFEKGNQESLFYREKIRERIQEQFRAELDSLPAGVTRRENGVWWISPPRFVKKEKQRVFWATRLNLDVKTFKRTGPGFADLLARSLLALSSQASQVIGSGSPDPSQSPLAGLMMPRATDVSARHVFSAGTAEGSELAIKETLAAQGKAAFEVQWSAVVTTKRNFTKPRLEGISYVGITWEQQT